MSKRVFIAGGSGFLGRQLVPLAAERYDLAYSYFSNDPHRLPNSYQLDLRDADAVLEAVRDIAPKVIVHLGGSNRPPDMRNVIVEGTRNLTAAARETGARLLQVSTDVLFDGTGGPYVESAEPSPIHAYGQAKADAEKIVAAYADQVTIRTSLIYNEDDDSSITWMLPALERGESITLFDNQWRNPVQVHDLSRALLELAFHDYVGVLHVAGPQDVTRAYFGRKFLTRFNFPTNNVREAPDTSGRWPLDVRLDTSLAQSLLQTKLRSVDEVFAGT